MELRSEFDRLRALPSLSATAARRATLRIRRPGGSRRRRTLGSAVLTRGRRTVWIYPLASDRKAQTATTLLHELVHASGCWRHDARFARRLLRVAREAWPEVDFSAAQSAGAAARDVDMAIEIALARHLRWLWWRRMRAHIQDQVIALWSALRARIRSVQDLGPSRS